MQGNHLPPIYVFPRQRFKDSFISGGPPGCVGFLSKSGWMTAELFIDVLKHIKKHTNISVENPILLVMDNHCSHCSLETVNFSKENGIVLLSLPPHTSNKLQPLDVAVFGPFKNYCKSSFNEYLVNNPGKKITIYDIASLTNQPFLRAFSTENIVNGFKATGIFPLNSLAFKEEDFVE